MKFRELKCPNCGAFLEVNEKILFCKFCGAKILVDNETINHNHNYTYKKVDEARIRETERKEKVKLKELEYQYKAKWRKVFTTAFSYIVYIAAFILLLIFLSESMQPRKLNFNEVQLPISAEEYIDENYETVANEFKNMGFTNIECIAQNDLITGWFTKDGAIERISIDGDYQFESGDIFTKDSIVSITYHTYKDK